MKKEDRELHLALNLKFSRRKNVPAFRSYKPGCSSWFFEPDEADFFLHVLEQTLVMAGVLRQMPDYDPLMTGEFLVRTSPSLEPLSWETETRSFPLVPQPLWSAGLCPKQRFEQQALPAVEMTIEAGLFLFPANIHPPGKRPQVAFALLLVERRLGTIIGVELTGLETDREAMYARMPSLLVDMLLKNKIRPAELVTDNAALRDVLEPELGDLQIRLSLDDSLIELHEARDSLFHHLSNS